MHHARERDHLAVQRLLVRVCGRALAAGCVLALASPIHAQQLRGSIVDSASRAPILGAVLLLLDSSGATLGRNITNERGEYTVALSSQMSQVRVLRIGFRPRVARIPEPVNGSARLDITIAALPALLQPVSVIEQPNCPRREDGPVAFALWEQAKAALLATVVAREANPADVTRLNFDRTLSTVDERVERLEVRINSAATTKPYTSIRSAAEFVSRGFVDATPAGRVYHAPDAEVLLDDAFPRGYCFGLAERDQSRPREVGLFFRAASSRRNRVDLDGVVWIDSTALSLSEIVYRYRGLPNELDRHNPGGHLWFRTMDNGSVIIDHWFIRFTRPATTEPRARSTNGWEVHEKGGVVARARWPAGAEWRAPLAAVSGQAFVQARSPANTRLRVLGTDYEVTTDSSGFFRLADLLPGTYEIGVADSILSSLDIIIPTGATFTAHRDSTVQIAVAVPSAMDYIASTCQSNGQTAGETGVVIRVLYDGYPASNVAYAVEVSRDALRGSFGPHAKGEADRYGVFVVCTAMPGDLFRITASRAGRHVSTVLTAAPHVETRTMVIRR